MSWYWLSKACIEKNPEAESTQGGENCEGLLMKCQPGMQKPWRVMASMECICPS